MANDNFKQVNIPFKGDYLSDLSDAGLNKTIDLLSKNSLINGNLITGFLINNKLTDGISLVGSVDTLIYHGLGKVWKGWFITRMYGNSGNAIVKESLVQPTNPDNTKAISLIASVDCTIHLWIF